ncbi:MAG: Mrp/NBP35 family ATP-binding protein [Euryarchaeota archaeon]|nr:Mrp/NBP35 family ATP-binding protein [Euryarchaeota archaeon]MDE1836040.1 Mrp/NBP35 family ATP-binding protein [Euryarchaeota archaeon]MDE1881228.1 Mrp/NBP35 family ATP-binding protein [Euryarchaeota archaeon]MDE2044018.1 Mrp/NBP35 family ATP-binding protein [Thermoplasmata archaeon]
MAVPSDGTGAAPSRPPPSGPGARRPGAGGGVLQRLPKGNLQNVIAVGSGKGGVGKSAVTVLLACELARQGKKVGILDADVTGPSVPKLLGLSGHLLDKGEGVEPAVTGKGLKVVSSQFLVEDEETPVIWRGPLVTRLIVQFFGGVNWGALDYLLLDMPPGTSDVPLTVFQTIPIDGMVFVTTPQELAGLIVKKAVNMARELHVTLLGLVENMATVKCPHCQKDFRPYGKGRARELAQEFDLPLLASLPIDPRISELGDEGKLEQYASPSVAGLASGFLQSLEESRKRTLTVL